MAIRVSILLMFVFNTCFASAAIPEDILKSIKGATVFVKMEDGSGTGFLLRREGNVGYVVTNEHVVRNDEHVSLVFNSGTENERTTIGKVMARDEHRDLAVLYITMENVPEPIKILSRQYRETVPVYILGFPYGEKLSEKHGSPEITISKGMITSIRKNEYNNIVRIDIEEGIHPGNSGGPVVDENGGLIGIAVTSTVIRIGNRYNNKERTIEFSSAISVQELDLMLAGRIYSVKFDVEDEGKNVLINPKIAFIDPMYGMKDVSILMISRDELSADERSKLLSPTQNEDRSFPLLSSHMQEFKLKIEYQKASCTIHLPKSPKGTIDYYMQVKYTRGDNITVLTEPQTVSWQPSEAKKN